MLDGKRKLSLPGLVEAHTHLNKSLLGLPWYRNEVGERLIDKIENERAVRKTLPIDPARQSRRHAMLAVSHGTTFIRSHVDVNTDCGVSGIEGGMATREAVADLVVIDLVAFPQKRTSRTPPARSNSWNKPCVWVPKRSEGSTRAPSTGTRRVT